MYHNIFKKSILTLMVIFASVFIVSNTSAAHAFTGTAELTLNGKTTTVAASNVDPIVLKAGEQGAGNLVISEFNMDVTNIQQSVVYTTKWPYAQTPVRPGSFEYSFTREGNTYTLLDKGQGGGLEIPINGVVVSTKTDIWSSATPGDVLSHTNFDIPTYVGAVEIQGSGHFEGASKNIRIAFNDLNRRRNSAESIYYNNQWGKHTNQNEFGIEVKITLNDQGEFVITEIRDLRNTKQLEIGAKDFIVSLHGDSSTNADYRGFLTNGYFVKVGDKASLLGMEFVNLSKTSESTITAYNPTGPVDPADVDELNNNKYFPGFRAANYLMYYDKDYVKTDTDKTNHYPTFTGTNEWGYEVLVEVTQRDGDIITGEIVTSAKQLDTLPDGDYFILSGNGLQEAYLINNSLAGSLVVLNKSTNLVQISSTLMSYISTVSARATVVNQMMQAAVDAQYKLNYMDEGDTETNNKWTRAQEEITNIIGTPTDQTNTSLYGLKYLIDNFEGEEKEKNVLLAEFNSLFLEALNTANYIESMSYSNLAIASIGAWHRPNLYLESNLEGVRQTIEIFKKAGLNTVYVETFWNGYSMSDGSAYVDYHKDFKGNDYGPYKDYLDAFITEAHLAGIEVHAWVENFFVGYEGFPESNILTGKLPNSTEDAPDAANRTGWVIRDYQNNEYTQFEGGKYKFIDPSNPEVRTFLLNYYKELLTNYEFDGINLDYIRYPVSRGYTGNVPYDHGYSEFAAKKFLAEQNYPENQQTLAKLKDDLNFSTNFESAARALKVEWDKFKIRQISEFVQAVHDMVSEIENERLENIIISTAVFAGTDALEQKHQDWESWIKDGLIEVTTPMVYYTNSDTVTLRLKEMINKIANNAYNYAGIAPFFMGLEPIQEVYQVVASLDGNAFGTVMFDSKTIINSEAALTYLSNGVSGNKPIVPHEEVNKLIDLFIDEMKSRADLYNITGNKLSLYETYLDELKGYDTNNSQGMINLMRYVLTFQDDTSLFASGHAITRINEELDNLYNILNVRYQRMRNGWIEESENPNIVDKTALENRVNQVNNLEASRYESSSWEALTNVLNDAQAIIDDENATQDEVNDALKSLIQAINALVIAKVDQAPASGSNGLLIGIIIGVSVVVLAGIGGTILFVKKRK